jgi:hypothetical protein
MNEETKKSSAKEYLPYRIHLRARDYTSTSSGPAAYKLTPPIPSEPAERTKDSTPLVMMPVVRISGRKAEIKGKWAYTPRWSRWTPSVRVQRAAHRASSQVGREAVESRSRRKR